LPLPTDIQVDIYSNYQSLESLVDALKHIEKHLKNEQYDICNVLAVENTDELHIMCSKLVGSHHTLQQINTEQKQIE